MSGASCLNCAAILQGPFCASCGQRHIAVSDIGVSTVLFEGFDFWRDKFALVRDLGWLLVSPGRLTRNWLAGARVRHLHPAKVWILCSAFAAFALQQVETDAAWVEAYTTRAIDLSCEQGAAIEWLRAADAAYTAFIGLVWTLIVFPWTVRLVLGPHRLGMAGYLVASLHASAAAGLVTATVFCFWDVARQLLEHDASNLPGLVAGGVATMLFSLSAQVVYTISVLWSGLGLSFTETLAASLVSVVLLAICTLVFGVPSALLMRVLVEAALAPV